MKRLMITAAALALLAGTASAKTPHRKGTHGAHGQLIQRPVRLQSEPAILHPNADLRYGPQPDYPQSPRDGGV